jgi:hypothetical protein
MDTITAKSAKQFLLSRIEEQALRDACTLSDVEKKMFLFSEATASEKMLALAQEFDVTCDDAEYESKISKLLRAAFQADKASPAAVAAWKSSLETLRDEDFYGMVMVQLAGLPFSPRSVAGDLRLGVGAFLDLAPVAAIALVVGVPGFLIVFDPFQWGLIHTEWIRMTLFPVFVFGVWLAVGRYTKSEFAKSRKSR